MKAVLRADGTYQAVTEEVPVRTADPHKRREERMPKTLEYTGDKGYKLADVLDKKFLWMSLWHRSVRRI